MRTLAPLSIYWFLYFAGLGIFFPFYSLYLRENAGLSGTEVGIVMATVPLVGMVAQPLWGQLADRSGARSAILALLTVATALAYAALARLHGFGPLVLGTAALAAASTAVLPVSMSVTFAALRGHGPHAFGLVRVWGTIGYLLAVALFPWAVHHLATPTSGANQPMAAMFPATAACTLAAAGVWPWLPRRGASVLRAGRGEWRVLLRSHPLRRLLVFNLLGYLFLQGPTALFPLFVRDRGGDLTTVGQMWVVMLLLEIPLVALSGAGLRRVGARGLLGVGVLAGGVRWLVCALSHDLAVLYPIQLLHGVVVAGLLLGGPLYLEMIVPERLRSTGQGLLATIGVGLGGILSNAACGWLIDHIGIDATYAIGGVGGLGLGCAVAWILPHPDSRHEHE
ncbi:MAG TPA: MFS transporter [Candidatus Dormibacteraeota bacterium]|nr:MFS transporter [Candidatus Dormibacteraeota bacterium]